MPTLTFFKSAQQVNFQRDGMDVVYFYKVSDPEKVHTIHVVGSDNSWNMSAQEKEQYAQILFTGAVSYIKNYWGKFKKLPPEDFQVYDKLDFNNQSANKTDWDGHTFDLT